MVSIFQLSCDRCNTQCLMVQRRFSLCLITGRKIERLWSTVLPGLSWNIPHFWKASTVVHNPIYKYRNIFLESTRCLRQNCEPTLKMTNNGTVYNTASAINPVIMRLLFHFFGVNVFGLVYFRVYLFKLVLYLNICWVKWGWSLWSCYLYKQHLLLYIKSITAWPDALLKHIFKRRVGLCCSFSFSLRVEGFEFFS